MPRLGSIVNLSHKWKVVRKDDKGMVTLLRCYSGRADAYYRPYTITVVWANTYRHRRHL